jgi:hypothetical protein
MKVPIFYQQLTAFSGAAIGLGNGLSVAASAVVPVNGGGSGYVVGDKLTVAGGTAVTASIFTVTKIGPNGNVLALALYTAGLYTVTPSNPAATTGGTGSGATLTVTWNNNVPPANATWCEVTVEGAAVRWRDDGTAPTSTLGNLLTINANGQPPFTFFEPLGGVQVIGVSSSSILNVQFYSQRKNQ